MIAFCRWAPLNFLCIFADRLRNSRLTSGSLFCQKPRLVARLFLSVYDNRGLTSHPIHLFRPKKSLTSRNDSLFQRKDMFKIVVLHYLRLWERFRVRHPSSRARDMPLSSRIQSSTTTTISCHLNLSSTSNTETWSNVVSSPGAKRQNIVFLLPHGKQRSTTLFSPRRYLACPVRIIIAAEKYLSIPVRSCISWSSASALGEHYGTPSIWPQKPKSTQTATLLANLHISCKQIQPLIISWSHYYRRLIPRCAVFKLTFSNWYIPKRAASSRRYLAKSVAKKVWYLAFASIS